MSNSTGILQECDIMAAKFVLDHLVKPFLNTAIHYPEQEDIRFRGDLQMQVEAGTISMLVLGFIIVTVSALIVVLRLFLESKDKTYLWFVGQFFFLSFLFIKFLNLIQPNSQVPAAMASEENSLIIGIIGGLWTISMFCIIMGIRGLSKKIKNKFV